MIGLSGRPEMAQRCQLCRDRAKATALASLGRLARETTSLDHNGLGDGLAPFTPARSRTLAVSRALELGDKTGLLELTDGTLDLTRTISSVGEGSAK